MCRKDARAHLSGHSVASSLDISDRCQKSISVLGDPFAKAGRNLAQGSVQIEWNLTVPDEVLIGRRVNLGEVYAVAGGLFSLRRKDGA